MVDLPGLVLVSVIRATVLPPTPMQGEWSGAVVTIRNETCRDIEAREQLLDRVWGPSRFEKTAERLREGRSPAARLSLVAEQDGKVVGRVEVREKGKLEAMLNELLNKTPKK